MTTKPHTITLFPSSLYELSGTLTEINPFPFFQQTHDNKKEDLPQFSPCTFEDNSRARDKKRISLSLLVLDMDSKHETHIMRPEKLHGHLNKFSIPHLIYTTSRHTPEKPRYRIIIPLDQPIPATSWKRFVPAALDKFHLTKLWPYLDHCTLNPASIFRLAPKTSIFFTGQHPLIPITIPPEPDLPPPTPLKLIDQDAYTKAAILGEIKNITDAKKGERNATLNTSSYALGQLVGSSDLEYEVAVKHLTEAANQAGLPDFEARRVIRLGLDHGANNPRQSHKTKNNITPITQLTSALVEAELSTDDVSYMGDFLRTQKKVIRSCEYNYMHAFNHPALEDIIYYNEFASRICLTRQPPWPRHVKPGTEQEWSDVDNVGMAAWLHPQKIYNIHAHHIHNVVRAVAIKDIRNPVRDYLDGLEWDNIDRIDTWLTDFFGVEPTVYSTSVGAMWLISAIARIYEPGCQVDHMLVLEGVQGVGKSTVLRTLAHGWFTDSLPDLGNKDAAIQLAGKWIVEMSELESFRKAEADAAKAFVSRRIDRYRIPHAKCADDFPRYNVFIGTTNSSNYLRDGTGNRRYWPVKCSEVKIKEMEESHDQLWAEAATRYRDGAHWWPEGDTLRDLCYDEAEERDQAHPWTELIEDYLVGQDIVGMDDILDDLKVFPERRNQGQLNVIAEILQKIGWLKCRRRVKGRAVWRYVRPVVVDD